MTAALPDDDFASARFDLPEQTAPRHLLILYSTPRSGSTMACDWVHRMGLCTPHEYFQPYEYRPALEKRWGVDPSDDRGYLDALCRHRTSARGVLGINLHGHHLKFWKEALPYLPGTIETETHLYLRRRDKVAQAVSYFIASATGKWSSAFGEAEPPAYDYKQIRAKLDAIERMEHQVHEFLMQRHVDATTLYYEDLCADPGLLFDILPATDTPLEPATIQRQLSSAKSDYALRFERDNAPLGRLRRLITG